LILIDDLTDISTIKKKQHCEKNDKATTYEENKEREREGGNKENSPIQLLLFSSMLLLIYFAATESQANLKASWIFSSGKSRMKPWSMRSLVISRDCLMSAAARS